MHGIVQDRLCTVQGALKHSANVATAAWVFVIAIHTWKVLFFHRPSTRSSFHFTFFGTCLFIALVPLLGRFVLQTHSRGPYFGISGYWCWITDNYQTERTLLEYMFMFMSAGFSFLLYLSIILKFRGNLVVNGWSVKVRRVSKATAWRPDPNAESLLSSQIAHVMKQMMWYPCVYMVIICPIAICRFLEWTNHEVSPTATIFSDFIFVLGGFFNSVLFLTTRRLITVKDVIPRQLYEFCVHCWKNSRNTHALTESKEYHDLDSVSDL